MRTVYVEPVTFKCHVINDGTMIPVETDAFDGKCDAYIEGSRFVPENSIWIREDGIEFVGAMFALWKPDIELDAAQRRYEQERLADAEQALAIMWGGVEE